MTTIKARLRGDDRTGHFTDECIENLVGQDVKILDRHRWDLPRGTATVTAGRRDVTDALIEFEVTRVHLSEGLPDGLPTEEEFLLVECGFMAVARVGDWLREIRLFEISPARVAVPASPEPERL